MNFFFSHTLLQVLAGGYGRLYNWWCTQLQYTRVKFGCLYNWWAVNDARGICASNARVPAVVDYTDLANNLGGASISGGKLKETGFSHWISPNTGATNASGFNAFGSGERASGVFSVLKNDHLVWCINSFSSTYANIAYTSAANTIISRMSGWIRLKSNGLAVRLIITSPIEINGTSAIYIGNDGRRYKCVLIGGIWWLAENLAETKYRNGDLIPIVTDNTSWTNPTSGAMCYFGNDKSNAFETASIAPVGWSVPTYAIYQTIQATLGGSSVMGGKLKETGTDHWLTPNTGATNESLFSAIGSGYRTIIGTFMALKAACWFWSQTETSTENAVFLSLSFDAQTGIISQQPKSVGCSIRLVKDDPSTWVDGDTVTDIDGNIYKTVKIGGIVIMAENLKVTKLNDGTPIPLIEDDTAWGARTEMAQCIQGNNPDNL